MTEDLTNRPLTDLAVAIVSICGPWHLRRCLTALQQQTSARPFEIVVAYDPALQGMGELAAEYPHVHFFVNAGQRTPLELASRAIRESRGHVVLLTEDHCVPHPDWVEQLSGSLTAGRAAAGGAVVLGDGASALDWAFYFVDFFRYSDPIVEGPSPTLTVCNVAYRRADLDALPDQTWQTFFHETAVNTALSASGILHLSPRPRVTMRRHVTARDAIVERYAFGRLFGATRLTFVKSRSTRLVYQAGALLLPFLLLTRMIGKALRSAEGRRRLASGLIPLIALTISWSIGEWLGYVTGRSPSRLTVAPESPEGSGPV